MHLPIVPGMRGFLVSGSCTAALESTATAHAENVGAEARLRHANQRDVPYILLDNELRTNDIRPGGLTNHAAICSKCIQTN